MDKKEWAKLLEKIYKTAPISKTLNSDIWFDDELRAHFIAKFAPSLCHAMGDFHGGIIAALVDNAIWFTAAAQYPEIWVTTSEFHTYIVSAPQGKDIMSEGWMIHVGKRTAVAKAEVRTSDGRLVAFGTGTLVVLPHVRFTMEDVKKRLDSIKV